METTSDSRITNRTNAAREIAHAGGPVSDQEARDALDDLGLVDDDNTEQLTREHRDTRTPDPSR